MKKTFLLFLIFFLFVANTSSYASYGGSTPGRALIDKTVYNPQTNLFVDNLSINNQHFLSGQEVIFRIEVSNTLNEDLTNLTVIDRLPSNLSYISSSAGTFDTSSNTVNFKISTLNLGDSKMFEIKTKVKSSDKMQYEVTCPTNSVELKGESKGGDKILDQDTSSFCITKQVLGVVQELPKTGPTTNIIFGASILSLLISAYLYRKYAKAS